jgi:hypothetical protein
MCKVIIEDNEKMELNKDIEFIIYNIVFDDANNITVTTDEVMNKLQSNGINIDKKVVKKVLDKWTNKGLLFNNYSNYLVNNSAFIQVGRLERCTSH